MAKLENYVELAQQTAREIAADGETWRSFLQTASTLYKYGFYDQMMIYAQRPDATACASFELWTNTMRRYVRRGAKGIALLDMTGDVPRYHYVFDAADTGMRKDSRSPFVWAVNEENSAVIGTMLEKEYRDCTEYSDEVVRQFVEKVIVHETVKDEDGERSREIEVYLNFIGKFDVPVQPVELSPEEQKRQEALKKRRIHQRNKRAQARQERMNAQLKKESPI